MTIERLAILGGQPLFAAMQHAGQWYMPPRDELRGKFRDIFARQYYTENGPMVQALEARLGNHVGVGHAICVSNASIAWLMLANVLDEHCTLLVPALATKSMIDSFHWFPHRRIRYDLDTSSLQASPDSIGASLVRDTGGIFLVDYWSGAADITAIKSILGSVTAPVFVDSTQGFGGRTRLGMMGLLADASVVSLHHSSILSAGEGACIFTNDADLADRLRTMRSSSGVSRIMPVSKAVNGRMSEAQAALALISLDHLAEIRQANAGRCHLYADLLGVVPGVEPVLAAGEAEGNSEHLICRVNAKTFGLDVGMLRRVLEAENVGGSLPVFRAAARIGWNRENTGSPAEAGTPGANRLFETMLRLPSGSPISDAAIGQICDLLRAIHGQSQAIRHACPPNAQDHSDSN